MRARATCPPTSRAFRSRCGSRTRDRGGGTHMAGRFFYHAFGVALTGRITRPFCDVIESQAATALGTIGGYGSSQVDDYRFRHIVSFRSARTFVVGSKADDGSLNTSVTVTVEGLNILNVIRAAA